MNHLVTPASAKPHSVRCRYNGVLFVGDDGTGPADESKRTKRVQGWYRQIMGGGFYYLQYYYFVKEACHLCKHTYKVRRLPLLLNKSMRLVCCFVSVDAFISATSPQFGSRRPLSFSLSRSLSLSSFWRRLTNFISNI